MAYGVVEVEDEGGRGQLINMRIGSKEGTRDFVDLELVACQLG